MLKILKFLAIGLAVLALGAALWLRTPGSRFDAGAALEAAKAYDARIIRDGFGVPHIYGKRDADVAFGLSVILGGLALYYFVHDPLPPSEGSVREARDWAFAPMVDPVNGGASLGFVGRF